MVWLVGGVFCAPPTQHDMLGGGFSVPC
jgi:hypothetical protein